ncbi:22114_t:CDS:2, partial [Racocetra persica]
TYISTSANLGELQSRKQEVLDNVRDLRRQNALNEAIQGIKNALSQQPVIENEELREIKQKKAKKEITGKLDELIRQAQTAITNNDLVTLEKLLNQIETYQSDSAYEERKADIERLFQQLAAVSLPKYRELTINSLDEFLRQDPPLSLDELEKANQNFAEQIKSASSAEEIKNIKNSVSNNINQGRSNKIVFNLINQAKQARTEEEKSAVRQKISELENSGNRWIKAALEAKKDELQQIVNSWILGEIPSNTNSPPSNDKKPNDNLPLIIFLVVVIGGIVIVG